MSKPTPQTESTLWPITLLLSGLLALALLLRPPVALFWTYGLHAPAPDGGPPLEDGAKKAAVKMLPPAPLPHLDEDLKMDSQPAPLPAAADSLERGILDASNRERRQSSRGDLAESPSLAAVAKMHSIDMRDHGFFAHDNLDGWGPGERAGKRERRLFGLVSENIEMLSEQPNLAEAFVEGWMNSPGHRVNLLRAESTDLGVGCAEKAAAASTPKSVYCTQLFMQVYASLQANFPETGTDGEAVKVALTPKSQPVPPLLRLTQVDLQTGKVVSSVDLPVNGGTASGSLTLRGPKAVYRLKLEIPDAKTQGRFIIVPGPYVSVQ